MSDDQRIDALRDDIEETRSDMSQTIEQLQERLAPEQLQQDTTDIVQQVADKVVAEIQGRTGDLASGLTEQIHSAVHGAASAKTEELLSQMTTGARGAGASIWTRLTENPVPIALASVAIGLLATGGKSVAQSSGQSGAENGSSGLMGIVDDALGKANTALSSAPDASSISQTASDLVGRAKEMMPSGSGSSSGASNGGGQLDSLVGGQPIVAGLVALGLGVALGLTIPETDAEREAAAPLREGLQSRMSDMGLPTDPSSLLEGAKQQVGSLAEQAKATAAEGMTQAKQAATDLTDTAKQTASDAAADKGLTRS